MDVDSNISTLLSGLILGDDDSEKSDKERQEHNERVVKFITKYVSCQIPNKTLSPILHDRVMKYQHHRCNQYCLRSKKLKKVSVKYAGLVFQDHNVTQFACVVL